MLDCKETFHISHVRISQKVQEVGEDLSLCVLSILPKVSSLPRLLTINLVKVEIQVFQTVM